MPTLIICRHGNTFTPEQEPRRIGRDTDMPLTQQGLIQAETLGCYLAEKSLIPDLVYSSNLKRTYDFALRALEVMEKSAEIRKKDLFDEISYGPDENKTEKEVVERIGSEAIDLWNRHAIPPQGWDANPESIKRGWMDFADDLAKNHPDEIVMVVTSNGVGRFAPYITGDYEDFRRTHSIKLKTGAFGIFEYDGFNWHVMEWNTRP